MDPNSPSSPSLPQRFIAPKHHSPACTSYQDARSVFSLSGGERQGGRAPFGQTALRFRTNRQAGQIPGITMSNMHVHVHVHVHHVYIHVYTCTCIYIYTYNHMHVHVHSVRMTLHILACTCAWYWPCTMSDWLTSRPLGLARKLWFSYIQCFHRSWNLQQ